MFCAFSFDPCLVATTILSVESHVSSRAQQPLFSDTWPERMFWHLLPAPVIGGQVYWLPPPSTEEWLDKKLLLDEKKQDWIGPNKRNSILMMMMIRWHSGESCSAMRSLLQASSV